jgi:type VI secretion system protein ImpA
MTGLLELFWDSLYPLPEDGDHFMRMNAVASLNDVTGMIRDLRNVDFLRSSGSTIGVRQAESLVRGSPTEGGGNISLGQLRLVVAEAWQHKHESVSAVVASREALIRMQSLISGKLPQDQQPELNGLQSLLNTLFELVQHDQAPTPVSTPDAIGPVQNDASHTFVPGALRTRDEAVANLLSVARFLEQTEPTNPAPLLIHRAVRLMRMDFMEILRELSPGSLAQVENIAGIKSEP